MIVDETVEPFKRRPDDRVIEGRNKSRIVVGTDREKEVESGYGSSGEGDPESGTVDVVAGADAEPNYKEDKARLYLSGKTDPDKYFGITAEEAEEASPAAVLISENTYIVGRNKIKIVHGDFHIIIDDDSVRIKNNDGMSIIMTKDSVAIENDDGQPPIRGNDFKQWASELTVLSPMGPLKINPADIEKITNILSKKVVIE